MKEIYGFVMSVLQAMVVRSGCRLLLVAIAIVCCGLLVLAAGALA